MKLDYCKLNTNTNGLLQCSKGRGLTAYMQEVSHNKNGYKIRYLLERFF